MHKLCKNGFDYVFFFERRNKVINPQKNSFGVRSPWLFKLLFKVKNELTYNRCCASELA